jgi:hypothetical protein
VAIVADPQLTDEASYASVRRGSALLRFVEYHSDVFMRKSFHELVRHVAPAAVLFAGDMFDGARYIPDAAYNASERRFDWVFERPDGLSYRTLPFFNLSGNHDIGWGPLNRHAQPAYVARYAARFGAVNAVHRIGGFDWVFLSACTSTVPPSSDPALHAETLDFLDRVAALPHDVPRILMTHVPLYRPFGTECGPLRVSQRPVTIGAGRDYINVLPQHVSEMILETVRPLAVFSGDDHDQCYVRHPVDAACALAVCRARRRAVDARADDWHVLVAAGQPVAECRCGAAACHGARAGVGRDGGVLSAAADVHLFLVRGVRRCDAGGVRVARTVGHVQVALVAARISLAGRAAGANGAHIASAARLGTVGVCVSRQVCLVSLFVSVCVSLIHKGVQCNALSSLSFDHQTIEFSSESFFFLCIVANDDVMM